MQERQRALNDPEFTSSSGVREYDHSYAPTEYIINMLRNMVDPQLRHLLTRLEEHCMAMTSPLPAAEPGISNLQSAIDEYWWSVSSPTARNALPGGRIRDSVVPLNTEIGNILWKMTDIEFQGVIHRINQSREQSQHETTHRALVAQNAASTTSPNNSNATGSILPVVELDESREQQHSGQSVDVDMQERGSADKSLTDLTTGGGNNLPQMSDIAIELPRIDPPSYSEAVASLQSSQCDKSGWTTHVVVPEMPTHQTASYYKYLKRPRYDAGTELRFMLQLAALENKKAADSELQRQALLEYQSKAIHNIKEGIYELQRTDFKIDATHAFEYPVTPPRNNCFTPQQLERSAKCEEMWDQIFKKLPDIRKPRKYVLSVSRMDLYWNQHSKILHDTYDVPTPNQLLLENTWTGELQAPCHACREILELIQVWTRKLPIPESCTCIAVKPTGFEGNSRPYIFEGSYRSYWTPLPKGKWISRALPMPDEAREHPYWPDLLPVTRAPLTLAGNIQRYSSYADYYAKFTSYELMAFLVTPFMTAVRHRDHRRMGGIIFCLESWIQSRDIHSFPQLTDLIDTIPVDDLAQTQNFFKMPGYPTDKESRVLYSRQNIGRVVRKHARQCQICQGKAITPEYFEKSDCEYKQRKAAQRLLMEPAIATIYRARSHLQHRPDYFYLAKRLDEEVRQLTEVSFIEFIQALDEFGHVRYYTDFPKPEDGDSQIIEYGSPENRFVIRYYAVIYDIILTYVTSVTQRRISCMPDDSAYFKAPGEAYQLPSLWHLDRIVQKLEDMDLSDSYRRVALELPRDPDTIVVPRLGPYHDTLKCESKTSAGLKRKAYQEANGDWCMLAKKLRAAPSSLFPGLVAAMCITQAHAANSPHEWNEVSGSKNDLNYCPPSRRNLTTEIILAVVLVCNLAYVIYRIYDRIIDTCMVWKIRYFPRRQMQQTVDESEGQGVNLDPFGYWNNKEVFEPEPIRVNAIHLNNRGEFSHNTINGRRMSWMTVYLSTPDNYKSIECQAAKDSGCEHTIMSNALFLRIPNSARLPKFGRTGQAIITASGDRHALIGSYEITISLKDADGVTYDRPSLVHVIQALSEDMLLGVDFLSNRDKVMEQIDSITYSLRPGLRRRITVTPPTHLIKVPIHSHTRLHGVPLEAPSRANGAHFSTRRAPLEISDRYTPTYMSRSESPPPYVFNIHDFDHGRDLEEEIARGNQSRTGENSGPAFASAPPGQPGLHATPGRAHQHQQQQGDGQRARPMGGQGFSSFQ